jgi:hypothetical protein
MGIFTHPQVIRRVPEFQHVTYFWPITYLISLVHWHWPPHQTFYIYPNPNHQAQPAFEPRAAATELPKSRLASAARWHPGKRPTTAAWRGHPLHNHALLVPPSLSPSPRHHPSRGHAGQPGALDQSTSRFVTQPGVLNPMSVVCWGLLSRCL